MEPDRELDAREKEVLAYLEDLQQNNPAEYELLVQQMQAQKGGSADGAPPGSEKVTPLPGFVVKTRSASKQGQKVFINVCQHEYLDPPCHVEGVGSPDESALSSCCASSRAACRRDAFSCAFLSSAVAGRIRLSAGYLFQVD